MKKLLLLLFFTSILFGCKKSQPSNGIIESRINIGYRNSDGQDILNPLTNNHIKKEEIDLFILVNGQKKRFYNANLDMPENFDITPSQNNGYYLNLFIPVSDENFVGDKVTAYLRYADGSEDEIIGEFNQDRSVNKILKKVWINGVLMAETNNLNVLTQKEFTILKN